MSRETTTLITVGPRTIAPWGDKAWRIALTAQLVEGSNPYWIVTPTQPALHSVQPSELALSLPEPEEVVQSILMLLAAHFGDEQVEGYLIDTHNIEVENGTRHIAPFYELAEEVASFLADRLSQQVRLGVLRLTSDTLADGAVIARLRDFGFDVDEYENQSVGNR